MHTVEEVKGDSIRISLTSKRSNFHCRLFRLLPLSTRHRATLVHDDDVVSVEPLFDVHEEFGQFCKRKAEGVKLVK